MTGEVFILACSWGKNKVKSKAIDLYNSPFFKKAVAFARLSVKDENIFILSAKHGLIRSDKVIEPYNQKLGGGRKKLDAWVNMVIEQAKELGVDLKTAKYFMGALYYTPLEEKLGPLNVYFKHRGLGQKMQALNKILNTEHQEELF